MLHSIQSQIQQKNRRFPRLYDSGKSQALLRILVSIVTLVSLVGQVLEKLRVD